MLVAFVGAPRVDAAEKVVMGTIGSFNAFTWPSQIAIAKGFYTEQGIEPDLISVPSAPAMLQQLAAGSLDVGVSSGLIDPLRLVSRRAPVAFARYELRISPYVLIANAKIATIADLKGKHVAIGSRSDVTYVLIEKMLATAKLVPDDVDLMYSGATAARYAALKTGAFDATLLATPLNFVAIKDGFRDLGIAGNFAKDLPFTGSTVNRNWAKAHPDTAKHIFAASDKASEWLHDKANRDEAIKILVESAHVSTAEAGQSYDFLIGGDFYDRTHKISRKGIAALVSALHDVGDGDIVATAEDCVVPGVTEIVE